MTKIVKYVFIGIVLATPLWALIADDIEAQRQAVVSAQATLDSLQSVSWKTVIQTQAEQDTTFKNVVVSVVTPSTVTGLRDPMWVDIDVPYSTWSDLHKLMWKIKIETLDITLRDVSVGRYSMHQNDTNEFLACFKDFRDTYLYPQPEE